MSATAVKNIKTKLSSRLISVIDLIYSDPNRDYYTSREITEKLIERGGQHVTDKEKAKLETEVAARLSLLHGQYKVRRTEKRIGRMFGYYPKGYYPKSSGAGARTEEEIKAIRETIENRMVTSHDATMMIGQLLKYLDFRDLCKVSRQCIKRASHRLKEDIEPFEEMLDRMNDDVKLLETYNVGKLALRGNRESEGSPEDS